MWPKSKTLALASLHEGKVFGKLTAISVEPETVKGCSMMRCICECGKDCSVKTSSLVAGTKKSCGCLWRKHYHTTQPKYGVRADVLYKKEFWAYHGMKARIYNPKHRSFDKYGGRGIKVCERWINSFDNFLSDMGVAPSPSHTLDRLDVNGDYSPENCRWATTNEQARNKTNNTITAEIAARIKNLKASGVKLCDIVSLIGLPKSTVGNVYYGRGWKDV